jgi:membrane fusion protein (multidrug efflux system)
MKTLLLGLFVLAAAAGASGCRDQNAAAATAPPPPPTVSVVTVAPERVAVTGEWIATLDGVVNAQIRPQVSGYLLRRAYREGAFVRKGEVLFEIDRRPLEATLSQATARLAEAKAQLAKSERDLARDTPLAEQRAIAQSQLDNDLSARDAAQAAQASAQAAVESAELNLRFTRVTSLVDGIAAIASAQIGDLVGPTTLLTTVSQVDPIKVYFPIGEQEYLGIAAAVRSPAALSRLWQEGGGLALVLADGNIYPHRGTVVAVDRDVDPKMGTIRLSATFPNPGNLLRPGQFGRVRAQTGVEASALLVPQRAVTELQSGHQVRVVKADGSIDVRPVTMGRRQGSRWIVTAGLKAGDRVVVDAPTLRAGTKVVARAAADDASTDAAPAPRREAP